MSKLKISPNLFLEVNELNKLVQFLGDDGYKPLLKHLTKSFGIAQNENNTYFKVSRKNETQNVVIINAGVAFDSNLNRIFLGEDRELEIPNSSNNQWILISYTSTNDEEGLVNISAQGALSGVGTKFTSVLRGQPNFPTKVKFNSVVNTNEYEVVDVTSDTAATLVGSFVAEQGLKYQVVGTFTPGFQPDDEDKAIYEYDSCRIDIVESEDRPELADGQFIIAKIFYVNNVINVSDERIRNLFNYEVKIDENTNNASQSDPFVALRQTTIRSERMLDIQFEWGYTVNRFELVTSTDRNTFNIITGSSKYISSNKIPDGIFKGWLLVNRKNMVSVVIDDNNSGALYITKLNPLIITDEGDDEFVIVPNVKDIEVEVSLSKIVESSSAVVSDSTSVKIETIDKNSLNEEELSTLLDTTDYGDTKHFFKFSIENAASRFCLPVEYGKTMVKLRYRIMSSTETTKFQLFANSQFTNIEDNKETLGESSFIITVNKPEEVQRNYS